MMENEILQILEQSTEKLSAEEICEIGKFSGRTVVSRCLRGMVESGKVDKIRQGRRVAYGLNDEDVLLDDKLDLWLTHEDDVWWDLEQGRKLREKLSENAQGILQFVMTEMLNNALDHSQSREGYIKLLIQDGKVQLTVRDFGVGVFRKVQREKGLEDEVVAIQTIMKGKTTTMPTAHSGEGIFWTSKLVERFILTSYEYRLIIDNVLNDYTLERLDDDQILTGTEVWLEFDAMSERSLADFFGEYLGGKEYAGLDLTVIHLGLYCDGSVWISRSQAKRVLAGLENYGEVEFDFSGIGMVGQAFCDEIFRVFAIKHPKIRLKPTHMGESVRLMVERVLQDKTGREGDEKGCIVASSDEYGV